MKASRLPQCRNLFSCPFEVAWCQLGLSISCARSLASLPVTGRGVKALVEVGPRTDIDFGDLFTHGWADFPLTINNKQSELPVYLKASRSSYFVCSPSKSMIPPLSTLPVMVRYKPKTLGSHKEELSLTLTSSSGYVLDKVPLNVRGTCSRVAEKPPLTGGIDKLPEDFIREPR